MVLLRHLKRIVHIKASFFINKSKDKRFDYDRKYRPYCTLKPLNVQVMLILEQTIQAIELLYLEENPQNKFVKLDLISL